MKKNYKKVKFFLDIKILCVSLQQNSTQGRGETKQQQNTGIMNYKGLTKEAILAIIKSLALSQGFYGRLLNALNERPEIGEEWLQQMEDMHFRDDIDFILYLEG